MKIYEGKKKRIAHNEGLDVTVENLFKYLSVVDGLVVYTWLHIILSMRQYKYGLEIFQLVPPIYIYP